MMLSLVNTLPQNVFSLTTFSAIPTRKYPQILTQSIKTPSNFLTYQKKKKNTKQLNEADSKLKKEGAEHTNAHVKTQKETRRNP
jgi:hypothetical protein